MTLRLFLDEDIYPGLAHELRKHGVDAESANELQRYGLGDHEQLAYAVECKRVLVTFNRDHFCELAIIYFSAGMQHWGIVVSPQYQFGELLRRLLRLCDNYGTEQMIDHIVYLQSVR